MQSGLSDLLSREEIWRACHRHQYWTSFVSESFDCAYSTTALEMLRISQGLEGYQKCLQEIYHVLKPGGIFGIGEPLHFDVDIPAELESFLSAGEYPWKECFRTLKETTEFVRSVGFQIIESDYAPDARQWWQDFAEHDPFCMQAPEKDPKNLEVDAGRWTSFGYIIAQKL